MQIAVKERLHIMCVCSFCSLALGCGFLRSQGFVPCGISLAVEAFFPVKFPSSDELAISKDTSAPVVISLSRPAFRLLPQNMA